MGSENYHQSCPYCDTKFIGFTDADMVLHLVEEHPEHSEDAAEELGLDRTKKKICGTCGREYVTYMGECPWCYHGDPDYT